MLIPKGKIADWFNRVEYQQRGSPHIHVLIWLEDAPVYGCNDDNDVTTFIDKIITCKKLDNDPELLHFLSIDRFIGTAKLVVRSQRQNAGSIFYNHQ